MTIKKGVIAALGMLVLAGPASAAIWTWSANLSGLQEVPPNASPGTGFINGTMDDVTGAVVVLGGSYTGLVGTVIDAHIHGLAPAGSNAGVIFGLTHTGGTSGTLGGGGVFNATQVAGMISGLTYVNVHSSLFPGGEIRGQITAVPEPSTVAALAFGSALLLLRRRR